MNMDLNSPKQFQLQVARQLQGIYPYVPIETEWCAITNISGLYSPRIDIAVGPFSIRRGGNCIEDYDRLMESSRHFIERLLVCHYENVTTYRTQDEQIQEALDLPTFQNLLTLNRNSRCLVAIEIEHRVSRKHLLGGALNACVLSRVGIVVGWTEEKVKALVKLQAYWDFLGSVGKNTFKAKNLIILRPEQLCDAFLQQVVEP